MARGRSSRRGRKSSARDRDSSPTPSAAVVTTSSGRRVSKSRFVDPDSPPAPKSSSPKPLSPKPSSPKASSLAPRSSRPSQRSSRSSLAPRSCKSSRRKASNHRDEEYEEEDYELDESSNSSFVAPKSTPRNSRGRRSSIRAGSNAGGNKSAKGNKKPWEGDSDEDDHHPIEDDDMFEPEEEEMMEEEEDPFKPEFEEDSEEDEDIPRGSSTKDDEDEEMDGEEEDSGEGSDTRPSLRMTIRVPPKYLELDEEVKKNIPELILPESSDDLVIKPDTGQLMDIVSIYEILRHFSNILRLSPFRFEDFSTSLMVDEESPLMSEIHIQLLKSLIREDEANGTLYVPSDLKDSLLINFFFIDHITWPDVLRLYLSSDMKTNGHLIESCFRGKEYPFVAPSDKVQVLKHLCESFLQTSAPRDDLVNEGIIKHDDTCRLCQKQGELLCCESCPAVFHLFCLDPPLDIVPNEDWTCPVCRSNTVIGVTDCKSDFERSGLLSRHEPIGWDRHGRRYWFLVRRIIVEHESDPTKCWYYSTRLQLEQLLESLDEDGYEADLVKSIDEISEELLRQMDITETLTRSLKRGKKTWLEVDNERIKKIQEDRRRKEQEAMIGSEEEPVKEEDEGKVLTNGPGCKSEEEHPSGCPKDGDSNLSDKGETSTDVEKKEDDAKSAEDGAELKSEESKPDPLKSDSSKAEERKGILTRLRTGSIQPKAIDLDPYKKMQEMNATSTNGTNEEVFVPKKDGSVGMIRLRRSQLAAYDPNYLFRLGQEIHSKPYVNLYQTLNIALNKVQQQEERDKKRHLSHKFSLTPASEFKWISPSGSGPLSSAAATNFQGRGTILATLRSTIAHLESQFHDSYLHPNWSKHRDSWSKAVKLCETASDFSLALCILEASMKPIVFNAAWNETQLGFTHLQKTTLLEREIRAKTEKRERKEERDENEGMYKFNVHVHYVKKLKHQIWKQKGEEYRLSGKGGWLWKSKTRLTSTGRRYKTPEPVDILDLTEEERETVAKEATINISYEMKKERRIFYPTVYTGTWNCNESSISGIPRYHNKFKNNMKVMEGLLARRLIQEKYQEMQESKKEQSEMAPKEQSGTGAKDQSSDVKMNEVKMEDDISKSETKPGVKVEEETKPEVRIEEETKPEVRMEEDSVEKSGETCSEKRQPTFLLSCYSTLCKFNGNTSMSCYSSQCNQDFKLAKEKESREREELEEKERKAKEEAEKKEEEEEKEKKEKEEADKRMKEELEEKERREREEVEKKRAEEWESEIKVVSDCRGAVRLGKYVVVEGVIKELSRVRDGRITASGAVCPVHRFKTNRGHRMSILVLPKYELRRLGRLGSFREVWGFNYGCKLNHYIWPYHTTPRPVFRTCWSYRTQRIDTIHAVALQLKNIWSSIRWDDLNAKPPQPISDRNTITTENEVITTEILKRREVPPYGLRFEYLIRRIVVPIELPQSKSREKATPIRSGLRERKRAESPQIRGPSVTESWHQEEELELWELKAFAEKLAAAKEKERLDRLRGLAPGTDPTSTRRILEEQIRQKMSVDMEKKGGVQKTIMAPGATAKGLVASGNRLVPRKSLLQTGTKNQQQQSPHPGFAMIKTITGQTFKVPMSALQGKQVGQTIIIKTAAGSGAPQTTTAATIVSIDKTVTSTPTLTPQVTSSVIGPKSVSSPATPNYMVRNQSAAQASGNAAAGPQRIQVLRGPAPNSTPVTQRVIIQQQPGAPAPGPATMAQIPVRLPTGQIQMIQIPLSMLNSNQPLQIQLQTQPPNPVTNQVIVSNQQSQTIQLVTQQQPQVRVVGTTPTGQRLVQIQRPVVPGQPMVQMQGNQIQMQGNNLLANQINQQLKAGTLQLRLPPTAAPEGEQSLIQPQVGQKIVVQSRPGQGIQTPQPKQIIIQTSSGGTSCPPTIRVRNPGGSRSPGDTSADTLAPDESHGSVMDESRGSVVDESGNFVMTSEMTNEIIKEALLNPNVTPEIHQKLLALQKHNAQNPDLLIKREIITPSKRHGLKEQVHEPLYPALPKVPNPAAVARGKASALKRKAAQAAAAAKAAEREKAKRMMSVEELEVTNREEAVKSTMKMLLDRIEKNERNESKRRKTKEVALQHKWKSGKHHILGSLTREADLLAREIFAKKSILQKEYRDQIQTQGLSSIPQLEQGVSKVLGEEVSKEHVSKEKVSKVSKEKIPSRQVHHSMAESDASQALVQLSSPVIKATPDSIPKIVIKKEPSIDTKGKDAKPRANTPVKRKATSDEDKATPGKKSKKKCTITSNPSSPEKVKVSPSKAIPSKTTPSKTAPSKIAPSKTTPSKATPSTAEAKVPATVPSSPKVPGKKLYCICQTPYNASRFMVGCDGCHNWFHGDCIGISEEMVETIDVWTCKKCQDEEDEQMEQESNEMEQKLVETGQESNGLPMEQVVETFEGNGVEEVAEEEVIGEDGIEVSTVSIDSNAVEKVVQNECMNLHSSNQKQEELFCLCRRPYDESQFYICCDSCQDWFHGRCVGVLPLEAEAIEEYVCPNCMKDSKINHANLKQLDVVDMVNLRSLLAQIKSHKSAWPFLQPVDAREVPDYYKVIKEPMDLKKVEQKITNNRYTKLAQFIGDMTKIFDNCRYYNDRKSPFYACAESLEAFFVSKIKSFRDSMS